MFTTPLSRPAFAWLVLILCASARGAEPESADQATGSLEEILGDTQRLETANKTIRLVWWVPDVYWSKSFEQAGLYKDPNSREELDAFVEAMRQFTVVMVVDGKVGLLGSMTYRSEEEIRREIEIIDLRNNRYRPLADEDISDETRAILAIMKPVLKNMLGPMGQNMHFLVFPARDRAGRRISDPKTKGSLTVQLGKDRYRYRLPLGSVLPPKTCADCRERCSGAWSFCPWCGKPLPDPPPMRPATATTRPAEL